MATLALARDEAESSGSAYAAALADVQEGAIWLHLGEWHRGLAALRRVRVTDLRLPLEQFATLLNRGLAEVSRLDLEAGRQDLASALELAVDNDWPEMVFKARHNLGCLEYFAGDLPAAIRLMRQADDMDVDVDRVRGRHDLGKVLLEAGLVGEATVLLRDTAEVARRRRQRLDEGEVLLDLVRAYLLADDAAEAARAARAAVRAFSSRGDWVRAEQAEMLRRAAGFSGGASRRRATTADPQTSAGRMGLRLLAEGALDRGDLPGARTALTALPRRQRDGLGSELHERFLRAWLADLEGDRQRRGRQLRVAAERLQHRQGVIPSLQLRASMSVHGRRLAELDLDQALRHGSPRSVYASLERWHAASQRIFPVTPIEDPEVARVVAELRQLRMANSQDAGGPDTADQADRLELRLQQLTWERRPRASRELRTASFSEVQSRLAETGQTLLGFVAHRDTHHCLVINSDGAWLKTLTTPDVDALAEQLRRDLRARALSHGTALSPMVNGAVRSSARALQQAVLGPVLELIGDSVVISPTRRLASVPWGALPAMAERPVTVAPSVSRWCATEICQPIGSVEVLTGPGLNHADIEAADVAREWSRDGSPTVRQMIGARSSDLTRALATPSLVHVAAHGLHSEQNPMFSTLRMVDGPVFAHEIRAARSVHAVISSCDVGQSHMRPGDEPLGLAAALLALGAGSVVAAVAPLPDEVAAIAMRIYHRHLAGGVGAAEALALMRAEAPGADALCLYGADWRLKADPAGEPNG